LYLGEINDSQRAAWIKQIEALDDHGKTHPLALFPDDVSMPRHAEGCGVQVRLGEFRLHPSSAVGCVLGVCTVVAATKVG